MLHEKLNNAVRAYDRLLEQRVANSYQRVYSTSSQQSYGVSQQPVYNNAVAPQQYTQPNSQSLMYPSMPPSIGEIPYPGQSSSQPFAASPRPTALSPTAPSHGNPLSGIQSSTAIPTQDPTPSADQLDQRHLPQTVSPVGDNHHVSYNYDNNNLGRWVTTHVSQQIQPPAPQQMNFAPAPTHVPQQQQATTRPQVEEASLIEL